MSNSFQRKNYRNNSSNPLPGLYRARVEYNKDDQQLGRVRIRIPQCHGLPGDDNSVKFDELPWAYPCTPFNSGYDYGTFINPEVGSYVWVMFEAGDPNQPVYIGSMYAKGSSTYQAMGTISDDDKLNKRYSDSNGRWNRPAVQNEIPVGSYDNESDFENSVQTLYKSPKGATIEIDETDEKESLSIIDRLGQIIKFISPVTKECNSYNAYRRYDKRADKENQYDTEEVSYLQKSIMLIKDARNQLLRFVAKKGSSKVDLLSKEDNSKSVLQLNSGEGSSLLLAEYESNKVYLKLDAKGLSSSIVVESNGKVLSEVVLASNVIINSSSNITHNENVNKSSSSSNLWVDTKDEVI